MKQRLEIKGNKAMFSGMAAKFKSMVEDEIAITTQNVADGARRDAPRDKSFLVNSITGESKGLEGLVQVRMEYAAYLEFGTGTKVDAGKYADYAKTFQGNTTGTFEEFKTSLLDWMARKGIDENALFPIMMSILRAGIAPQPFLFPAFELETNKMLERLKTKIKNGTKS